MRRNSAPHLPQIPCPAALLCGLYLTVASGSPPSKAAIVHLVLCSQVMCASSIVYLSTNPSWLNESSSAFVSYRGTEADVESCQGTEWRRRGAVGLGSWSFHKAKSSAIQSQGANIRKDRHSICSRLDPVRTGHHQHLQFKDTHLARSELPVLQFTPHPGGQRVLLLNHKREACEVANVPGWSQYWGCGPAVRVQGQA